MINRGGNKLHLASLDLRQATLDLDPARRDIGVRRAVEGFD
jgi:hypothetical protein